MVASSFSTEVNVTSKMNNILLNTIYLKITVYRNFYTEEEFVMRIWRIVIDGFALIFILKVLIQSMLTTFKSIESVV